jgi:hypothetical protein
MKMVKLIACFALVVAALVYAGGVIQTVPSGLAFVTKYPTTIVSETNGWVIIRGSGDSLKETIGLASKLADGSAAPGPTGQCLVIECAKGLKGSRKDLIDGHFSEVVYGVFTNADGTDAVGDYSKLTLNDPTLQVDSALKPGKSFSMKLKGVTVGTVIAKKCAPTADSISHALLTEAKALKGVALTAGGKGLYGILGTGSNLAPGTVGIAPGLTNFPDLIAQINPVETALGKATAKNQMLDLMIFSESIPPLNGKAKAKLISKYIMMNVNTLTPCTIPGAITNSSYSAKFYFQQTLAKP